MFPIKDLFNVIYVGCLRIQLDTYLSTDKLITGNISNQIEFSN